MTSMVTDWNAELALLQDPLYREGRTVYLNTLSLAQRHSWIFHLYNIHCANDELTMWILQTIASVYDEMDSRAPGHGDEISEQLQRYLNNSIGDVELLAERLTIIALLR